MVWTPPPAWSPPEPEWVVMAPGVRWLLQPPNGGQRHAVAAEVGAIMARVYQGRAEMESLGLDDDPGFDAALSLDRIQGAAGVLSGCLFARICLQDWEGVEADGAALDHSDPDNVKAALLFGAPGVPNAPPLLTPFLAWLEGPKRPMAAEAIRLQALAEDHWSGGSERCRACEAENDPCARGGSVEGQLCPRLANQPQTPVGAIAWSIAQTDGLWVRAGMSGVVTGLDHGAALLAFEPLASREEPADFGAAFLAFRAIEAGRMKAEARAAEDRKAAEA